MSSILKALKKLENNPPEEGVIKPLYRKVEMKQSFANTARGLGMRRRIVFISLTSLLLFGGWLFSRYGMAPSEKVSSYQEIRPPMATPAKSKIAETKKRPHIIKLKPVPVRSEAAAVSVPQPIAPEGKPALADGAAALNTRKQPEQVPPAPQTSSNARADRLTVVTDPAEPGFEIQAIAWSSIPEKRIAVINGKVLHEGAHINGAYVSRIHLNDVLLKKGNKTWKITFAGQQ